MHGLDSLWAAADRTAGGAPATAGAILGAATPLTAALSRGWQHAILVAAAAAAALLLLRRAVLPTLLLAGVCAALLGATIRR